MVSTHTYPYTTNVERFTKLEKDCPAFRQQLLYMGVYQCRENPRFYGTKEDPEGAEDTRQVGIDLLQLGIYDEATEYLERLRTFSSLSGSWKGHEQRWEIKK